MTDDPDRDTSNEHRLNMLMDYTKFHIGLYAVVITTLLALAKIAQPGGVVPDCYKLPILATLVLVLLAGMCGGLIAAHLPEQKKFDGFWEQGRIGPWGSKCFRVQHVARAEHLFFWLAVAVAVVTVALDALYPDQAPAGPGGLSFSASARIEIPLPIAPAGIEEYPSR